jgi:hypothetical protein
MMKGTTFTQRHADQRALGGFGGFADGFRHFACLTMTETNAAFLVTNDDKGCETETTATLYDFGNAVDMDQTIHKF